MMTSAKKVACLKLKARKIPLEMRDLDQTRNTICPLTRDQDTQEDQIIAKSLVFLDYQIQSTWLKVLPALMREFYSKMPRNKVCLSLKDSSTMWFLQILTLHSLIYPTCK